MTPSKIGGPVTAAMPARRFAPAAIVLLVLAAVVRLAGMTKPLWLDEIWSLHAAGQLHAWWDVFTLHHEINHHLNTLWLFFVGRDGSTILYHLPSLVAGICSVWVAGRLGRRRTVATGLIAMWLVGFSYELVLFSSEARGYSTLVLFSLLSYYCLERYLDDPALRWAIAYGMCAIFGVLSQPIFFSFLAAACVRSGYRVLSSERPRRPALLTALRLQTVPLLFAAALYLGDLRYVVAGGGTPTHSLIDAYGTSLAWAVGTPQSPAMELLACVVVVAGLSVALRRTFSTNVDQWAFFIGVIVVFPIALIIVRGSALVYTRHFLVGTTFALLLLSHLLGDWWRHGRSARVCTAALLACYAMLNGYHIVDLARHGRGQYVDAIRYIADHTAGPMATIGADQDFRVGTELEYYLADVDASKPERFFEHGSWPAEGPEWLIAQAESFETLPPPENVGDGAGHEFTLAATFPTAPLSGLHWFVYHNRASK